MVRELKNITFGNFQKSQNFANFLTHYASEDAFRPGVNIELPELSARLLRALRLNLKDFETGEKHEASMEFGRRGDGEGVQPVQTGAAKRRARAARQRKLHTPIPAEPPADAWADLDDVDLEEVYSLEVRTLQACPAFL